VIFTNLPPRLLCEPPEQRPPVRTAGCRARRSEPAHAHLRRISS